VLGANDGIVSTASLILGVAASGAERPALLVAGIAGLVAGAMSMAAGEYVSVSSQADAEAADIAKEKAELADSPAAERAELVAIYQKRGLDRALAEQVTDQLMAKDALKAHLRDELGLTEEMAARPIQAAWASALAFSTASSNQRSASAG
jgi:VIT1/CCC1 family predicted Fe2+/Mn2+ transporter